ncbi:MAG: hypothetical protein SFW08_13335 [Gemmatimonadaceae bacterium]|nr:hypothetical protein [Gemmatimonadaceae bacterium]
MPNRSRRFVSAAASALLLPLITCAAHAQSSAADTAWQSLVTAERAFAAKALSENARSAFLANFSDASVLFVPRAVNAKRFYTALPVDQSEWRWVPDSAEVAVSGDLGTTTGPATIRPKGPSDPNPYHTRFFSIWQRQPDGRWALWSDIGDDAAAVADLASVRTVPTGGVRGVPAPDAAAALAGLRAADSANGHRTLDAITSAAADVGATHGEVHDATGRVRAYVRWWRRLGNGQWRVARESRGGAVSRPAGDLRSGIDVLAAMRDAHAPRMWKTLTFVQRTGYPDGRSETWYETLAAPGMLRIDMAPIGTDSSRSLIFRRDSIYQSRGGVWRPGARYVHPLMVLLTDALVLPPYETARRMRPFGLDAETMHRTRWEGREVYVIGAAAGDTSAAQAWIDADRLVVLRWIEPARAGRPAQETRIHAHVALGRGALVERDLSFYSAGRVVQTEQYDQLRADPPGLEPDLFVPGKVAVPAWVRAALTKGSP